MTQEINGSVFVMTLTNEDSSIIRKITYDIETHELEVEKTFGKSVYINVPTKTFFEFSVADSIGSFYHSNIKNNFMGKTKVEKQQETPVVEKRKPKKINKASNDYRWIDIDVDLDKLNPKFLVIGQKTGHRFLKMRLRMEPDGDVDKFGNLGFVAQVVPTDMYKKDKSLKGEILGNACELVWDDNDSEEETKSFSDEASDFKMPF
jgi:hypothetical protein